MTYTHPNGITGDYGASLLVEDGTYRYGCWYTLAGELMVGRQPLAGGTWTTHQIAGAARTTLALPVAADDHNYPSLGIDSAGRLHLWANMHANPIKYVRSTSAGATDITSWATGPALPSIDNSTTYPTPIHRPDGTLHRVYFRNGPWESGTGKSDGYIWDWNGTAWGARTMLFRGLNVPNAKGPGVPGDDETVESEYNWSPYPRTPYVEDVGGGNWVEHWFWFWRHRNFGDIEDPGDRTNIEPSYMQYRSATGTWHNVTGAAVTLPLDPVNNYLSTTTGQVSAGEGYLNFISGCLDGDGHPHMLLSVIPYYHVWWDGTAWQQQKLGIAPSINLVVDGHQCTSPSNLLWLRGRPWVLSTVQPYPTNPLGIARHVRFGPLNSASAVTGTSGSLRMGGGTDSGTYAWGPSYSQHAWLNRGAVEVLCPDGDTPRVIGFGTGARVNN